MIDFHLRMGCTFSIQTKAGMKKERGMGSRLVFEDRRSLDGLTQVVDDALTLADDCGWRYALAYLISERVPSQVIQRLLSGNARARKAVVNIDLAFPVKCHGRTRGNTDEMQRLFTALLVRRTRLKPHVTQGPPAASRHSGPLAEED